MFKIVSLRGVESREKKTIELSLDRLGVRYEIRNDKIVISKPDNDQVLAFLGLRFTEATKAIKLTQVSLLARDLTNLNQNISKLETFFKFRLFMILKRVFIQLSSKKSSYNEFSFTVSLGLCYLKIVS